MRLWIQMFCSRQDGWMALIANTGGSIKARGRGKNTKLGEEGGHINETFLCRFLKRRFKQ